MASVVSLSHLGAEFAGKRLGGPIALLGVIAVSAAVLGWRHGLDGIWIILLLIATASILYRGDPENEPIFTNGMALMSLPLIIAISTKDPSRILDSTDSIPNIDLSLTSVTCTGLVMGFYLPRAEKMEKLLKPAGGSMVASDYNRTFDSIRKSNIYHGWYRFVCIKRTMACCTRRD